MSAKYQVMATNDVTCVLIATKFTLIGALSLACDLMDTWDDIHVREYEEEAGLEDFKVVAKVSGKGLL